MDVVIVGSGPSAAAVALVATQVPGANVTVVDVGGELEDANAAARRRMGEAWPAAWSEQDRLVIAEKLGPQKLGTLPQKHVFGSDFPFADFGQLSGIDATPGTKPNVVSGAYGGFSNTWGAQVVPYSTGTFSTWPFGMAELESHYRAVLTEIPYAAETDDLADYFPLVSDPHPLPKLSYRATQTLSRYARHRVSARRRGVVVGHARLALNSRACRLCGLCMTGCPYGLIYSSSQTFDRLRETGRVQYVARHLVFAVREENSGRPEVLARDLASGRVTTFSADYVFVAAGAVGSTRIVANSLGLHGRALVLRESAQFLVPFVSLRPAPTLTQEGEFTLNQFNVLVTTDALAKNAALIHCYPFNDIMLTSLPSALANGPLKALTRQGLRRLTIGLGYLPSWGSPSFEALVGSTPPPGELPDLVLSAVPNPKSGPMLADVLRRLRRSGPELDLHPLPGQTHLADAGGSYHFGGSFPHTRSTGGDKESDLLGRVGDFGRVHLVDGSVFPTIPGTTFTLTIMANAHRIASEVLQR